jgi:hypothetical protein
MMLFTIEQLQTIERIAEIAVKSGHYQYAVRENGQTIYNNLTVDQAISIIMTGVELGVGPMTALRNITPYRQGKPPIMSAHLESSLAQAHGYQIVEISKSDIHVELAIERAGKRLGTYKLTLEQVRTENRGKLTNNWQTNTLDMLLKTAKVRLVRTYASQALGGSMYISEEMPQHISDDTYTPDELGGDDDTGYTEPVAGYPRHLLEPEPPTPAPSVVENETPALPPKSYLREERWSELSTKAESTKYQRTTIGALASKLFGADKAGKEIKAEAVNNFAKQDGVTSVTHLSQYDAEWFWVLLSIERTGRELYGGLWETEKRLSAVKAYTDGVVTDLYDMPRGAACKLLDRLERDSFMEQTA